MTLDNLNHIEKCCGMQVIFRLIHKDDHFAKIGRLGMDCDTELENDLLPVRKI